jgi:hypothetical protein
MPDQRRAQIALMTSDLAFHELSYRHIQLKTVLMIYTIVPRQLRFKGLFYNHSQAALVILGPEL